MTMKQREDHVQAKYWNGFLTRTEAQKVFDDQMQVIMRQAEAFAKFDAALSCIAEKVGVTPQDVNVWVQQKVAEAEEANKTAKASEDASNQGSTDTEQQVSRIIAA